MNKYNNIPFLNLSPVKVYYIYSFLFSFFFTLLTAIFSIYHIDVVQLNPFQLVLVGTILEASCFLFEIPTGIIADIYSRKLSLVIGLMVMGLGIFIEGYFPVFWIVASAQIIWGIGATFLSGADIAWLNDELKGKGVEKVLLRASQLRQAAILIGIVLSISIATFTINLPIIISGIMLFLLGLSLFFLMPEKNFIPRKNKQHNPLKQMGHTFTSGTKLVKRSRFIILLFVIALLGGLYSEGFDRLWLYRFWEEITLPTLGSVNPLYWFAIIHSGSLVINFIVTDYLRRNSDRLQETKFLVILSFLNLLLSASIFFFAFAGDLYLALTSFWIAHAIRNANAPLNDLLINRKINDSGSRATVISMKGQLDQLGQIVGGPVIGFVASAVSVPVAIAICGVIILPIIFLYSNLSKGRLLPG